MVSRSFVDLIFILLCAVVVLLTQSVRLHAMKVDPVKVGSGGSRSVAGSSIEIVAISDDMISVSGKQYKDIQSFLQAVDIDAHLLIVPENNKVSHHRVIKAWWEIQQHGRQVELGVSPTNAKES